MNGSASCLCQEATLLAKVTTDSCYHLIPQLSLPLLLAYIFASALGSNHALLHGVFHAVLSQRNHWLSFSSTYSFTWQHFIWLSLLIVYQRLKQPKQKSNGKKHDQNDQHAQSSQDVSKDTEHGTCFLQPLLFPSQTTHRRLFPKVHNFSYSYLLVGVPVSNKPAHYGPMLSSHASATAMQTWFSVCSSDYLDRGAPFCRLFLRQKLDRYLLERDVQPSIYPYAYLVTAPRFLGFSFNPVSFWYLYTADRHLGAMILEVNNTFDERRLYLLQPDPLDNVPSANTASLARDILNRRFKSEWRKDFHVSPFNDRKGSYSVSAVDVAATGMVDVTIVLREPGGSSEGEKAKVVARVWSAPSAFSATRDAPSDSVERNDSVGKTIDPATMTKFQRARFLFRYSWIVFLTNPRILREARILWMKKLKVFYRPEPCRGTISRNESKQEAVLERCFCRLLHKRAIEAGLAVRYMPAAGRDRGMFIELGHKANVGYTDAGSNKESVQFEMQVLTPSFYAEVARMDGTLLEVFERLCFQSRQSEAMVWVSDEERMRKLLRCMPSTRIASTALTEVEPESFSIMNMSVTLLRGICKSGLSGTIWSYWEDPKSARDQSRSELDKLMGQQELEAGPGEAGLYLRAVLVVLLADCLSFGSTCLFRLELRALRVLCVVLMTGSVLRIAEYSIESLQ